MDHGTPNQPLGVVPLFPLPNVVLFPRAVLPLHIFEERYKTMTADALGSERVIAMALLKPGWEKGYHGAKSVIEPVVCIGEILTHERLDEGKYNFLLRGRSRARIVREISGQPYRQAEIVLLHDDLCGSGDLSSEGRELAAVLAHREMSGLPGIEQFRELAGGLIPVHELADLLAFHVLDEIPLKQALLSEINVQRRVRTTIAALEAFRAALPVARPKVSRNPSMN